MVKVEIQETSSLSSGIGSVVLVTATSLITLSVASFLWRKWNRSNPFQDKYVKSPRPVEMNRAKREKVLKQGFRLEKIPKNLDAIVIGSGMGGLVCAGCLSRAGKRVLVLEQHDRAGGSTHTYEEKGFEFDIGVHYVGELGSGSMNHTLFDVLSDGQVVWEEMDQEFDAVVMKQKDESNKIFKYKAGKGNYEQRLLEYFPKEEKAIRKFIKLVKQSQQAIVGYTFMKQLPLWLIKILSKTGIYNLLFARYNDMTNTSLKEALDKLTQNEELKVVLGYCFGDYGAMPSEAPVLMHGVLMGHFWNGGYYPRGGSSELAYHMIPGIERSGGAVLVRATVSKILFEDNRACGVCIERSGKEYEIYAPTVISSAGLINTYDKLIPKHISNNLGIHNPCSKVDRGLSCFQILVGLKGTSKELGLKKRNYWMFTSQDPEREFKNYLSLSREDAVNVDIPILFTSFPSTKDSSWEMRFPGKSTCVIVTFLNWEWFEEWENERVMKRGQIYEDLKRTFQDRAWKSVIKLLPQLEDKVEFIDSGTPLSHQYYLGQPKGDIYGIDHTRKRFQYDLGSQLRPTTGIPGLYLTGQDTFTCGVAGAALSGMITSGAILGRNHFFDLFSLMAKRRLSHCMKK